jgi:hypothetical protein
MNRRLLVSLAIAVAAVLVISASAAALPLRESTVGRLDYCLVHLAAASRDELRSKLVGGRLCRSDCPPGGSDQYRRSCHQGPAVQRLRIYPLKMPVARLPARQPARQSSGLRFGNSPCTALGPSASRPVPSSPLTRCL